LGVFDRFFELLPGSGRRIQAARRAELRGDLARAAELWGLAEKPEEAARVMILRGDAEVEAGFRMQHYVQAVALAPRGHDVRREARLKRALLTISIASTGVLSASARRDLLAAAKDLEDIDEPERAAEAYRVAEDYEGEARALASAGDVDKLEKLLSDEEDKDRRQRRRQEGYSEVDLLMSSGRRREALARALDLAKDNADDRLTLERADFLRARKVTGPIVRLSLHGKPITLVLGLEVIVGRTEGAITVQSHAISRRHVRIARAPDGSVQVADAGSRNGTQLRGMNLSGALAVGDGLELHMGKEVPLRLGPSEELAGATTIEVAGAKYVAPLGPVRLPIEGWTLEEASDGWVELVTREGPAFLKDVSLVSRATLLAGDSIAAQRGGAPVLEVVA
jgi:hypothetical protein